MRTLTLENHKAYVGRGDEKRETDDLVLHLSAQVSIGENFLFRDLWKLIAADAERIGEIFDVAMGGHPIKPYVKEALSECDQPDPNEDGPTRLEVYREVRCRESDKHPAYTNIDAMFRGFDDKGERWGIGFTPLSELGHLPLTLNGDLTVTYQAGRKLTRLTCHGANDYLLFDVIYAILFEVTFYGLPVERAAQLAELDQRVTEAKEMVGDGRLSSEDCDNDEHDNNLDAPPPPIS